ncbi:MAG TPA: TIGR03621 family F420-dependent LLM class oxidoreductase [Acidimicrobiia bacterium]|nr:TIGR03621 family F420-dependent LLM class oxidoreductase [Acidimicrobiia bacterium]
MRHANRPLRFGVITSHAPDGSAWRARAQRAEALGYSSLLMPDHFQDQWAPIVGLTVAAEATTTLRVGTLVFDNDYRHPVVLAKELATLDRATGGRLEVGIGAEWKRTDYDEAGIPYDRPGVRIERMAEALTVMRALWASEEPVVFEGTHYRIQGAVGTPRPTQVSPPVCIGGGGRRILSLAARAADIVSVNVTLTAGELGAGVAASATPQAFDEKIGWIRDAAGERFETIELQCHCPFVMVTADATSIAERMGAGFGLSATDALEVPLTLFGTVDELCDMVEARRERYGFSYWIVPDDAMEAFGPVVARLAGR